MREVSLSRHTYIGANGRRLGDTETLPIPLVGRRGIQLQSLNGARRYIPEHRTLGNVGYGLGCDVGAYEGKAECQGLLCAQQPHAVVSQVQEPQTDVAQWKYLPHGMKCECNDTLLLAPYKAASFMIES